MVSNFIVFLKNQHAIQLWLKGLHVKNINSIIIQIMILEKIKL